MVELSGFQVAKTVQKMVAALRSQFGPRSRIPDLFHRSYRLYVSHVLLSSGRSPVCCWRHQPHSSSIRALQNLGAGTEGPASGASRSGSSLCAGVSTCCATRESLHSSSRRHRLHQCHGIRHSWRLHPVFSSMVMDSLATRCKSCLDPSTSCEHAPGIPCYQAVASAEVSFYAQCHQNCPEVDSWACNIFWDTPDSELENSTEALLALSRDVTVPKSARSLSPTDKAEGRDALRGVLSQVSSVQNRSLLSFRDGRARRSSRCWGSVVDSAICGFKTVEDKARSASMVGAGGGAASRDVTSGKLPKTARSLPAAMSRWTCQAAWEICFRR